MSEVQMRPFNVCIPNINRDGIDRTIVINVPVRIDPHSGEEILTPEAHELINKTKFPFRHRNTIMTNPKRIVIIDGDAFDADAIVAIVKSVHPDVFCVYAGGVEATYHFSSRASRIESMHTAIAAWRSAVGDLPVPHPEPLPFPPVIEPDDLSIIRHWSDEKGRYYETYGGSTIYFDPALGNFIWNEGPPRRKNPLGPEASPIVKVYIGQDGKPLDPQPV